MSIAVNEDRLREILGGTVEINNQIDAATARIFTDTHEATNPIVKFGNARHWVKRAYEMGMQQGKQDELDAHRRHIRELFGL